MTIVQLIGPTMPTAETRGRNRKPLPAGAAKTMFSLRLSTEARSILDRLSRHHGIDRTAVVEQELRRAGRRDLATGKPTKK